MDLKDKIEHLRNTHLSKDSVKYSKVLHQRSKCFTKRCVCVGVYTLIQVNFENKQTKKKKN